MTRMKRIAVGVSASAIGLVFAVPAFAAPGDAPTFDPSTTLGPALNDYSTSLVSGIGKLWLIVLVPAAIFTLYSMAKKAVTRWIGRGKATSAV